MRIVPAYPAYRQAGGRQARYIQGVVGMAWSVYAISSLSRSYIYVGLTSNVENRIERHNLGRERTTKPYRPFRLIWTEEHESRAEARKREIFLKSGCGKEFLKEVARATRQK